MNGIYTVFVLAVILSSGNRSYPVVDEVDFIEINHFFSGPSIKNAHVLDQVLFRRNGEIDDWRVVPDGREDLEGADLAKAKFEFGKQYLEERYREYRRKILLRRQVKEEEIRAEWNNHVKHKVGIPTYIPKWVGSSFTDVLTDAGGRKYILFKDNRGERGILRKVYIKFGKYHTYTDYDVEIEERETRLPVEKRNNLRKRQ